MGILTTTAPNREQTTKNSPIYLENTTLLNIEPIEKERLYILIPLAVLLAIILLSLLVYLMASNRRRLVHMYYKRQSFLYKGNEYGSPLEEDSDDVEENEDAVDDEINPTSSLLRGKLQIHNPFENYLSTSQLNRSPELFT